MIRRRQLPVASPLSARALARGLAATAVGATAARARVIETIRDRYHALAVALTDSGTSALVAALRLVTSAQRARTGAPPIVAYPAYTCVDLIAAARQADVRVRLYDIDPTTLSPDLDSLYHVMADGVDAVVAAHLYGFPADVTSVKVIAAQFGVPVIEDAAQHAGATLHNAPTGGLGDVAILSFGRGKGLTAGNGGAVLALTERWRDAVDVFAHTLPVPPRGANTWISATASWLLGRPSIYDIPSSIPALHLGETVYHDAHDPTALSSSATAILESSLATADHDIARRRHIAATLATGINSRPADARIRPCIAVPTGNPGYLRFPILADPSIAPIPRLGIMRSYPRPLSEQLQLRPILLPSDAPLYGAHELATSILTLPTHHMVTPGDLRQLTAWLRTT